MPSDVYSLLVKGDGIVRLSPAYDLLNTTIAMPPDAEDLALPLRGKKRGLTRDDLISYYARERLGLTEGVVMDIISEFSRAVSAWAAIVEASFLPPELRRAYLKLLQERRARLGI